MRFFTFNFRILNIIMHFYIINIFIFQKLNKIKKEFFKRPLYLNFKILFYFFIYIN